MGAIAHAILLAISLSELFNGATILLFLFALPGLMVDMSSEIIHPSSMGGNLLVVLGTIVNGAAYAAVTWIVLVVTKKQHAPRHTK